MAATPRPASEESDSMQRIVQSQRGHAALHRSRASTVERTEERVEDAFAPVPGESRPEEVTAETGMLLAQRANQLIREVRPNPDAESLGYTAQLPKTAWADPAEYTFIQHMLMCSPHDVHPPYLTPETELRLRQSMRPSPRDHEDAMLREPGKDEPTCVQGQACMGYFVPSPGEPRALMSYYFPDEWADYKSKSTLVATYGGKAPLLPSGRKCLLCLRAQVAIDVIMLKNQNGSLKLLDDSSPLAIGSMNMYNIVDVPGEYRAQDCLLPVSAAYHGLVGPMVKLDVLSLRAVKDADTGRYRYVQLLPRVGDPPDPAVAAASARADF